MTHRGATTDCAEQGLRTNRGFLMGPGGSVQSRAINGLEVNHRVRLQVEEIPGERQMIDVKSLEVRGETFNRVEVVDGEYLGVSESARGAE